MKRDIRDILREGEENFNALPENHMADFIAKTKLNKKNSYKTVFLKIASVMVLMVSLSYLLYTTVGKNSKNTTIENEISKIQDTYQKQYDSIWKSINKQTINPELLQLYQPKLDELINKYNRLSKKIKEEPNNLNYLEALINNLQNRLRLLKDIQEHSKSSNQTYEQHETIIL